MDHNRHTFKTPTPLGSELLTRNQFIIGQRTSESREIHTFPTHTFNSFHRIDELSENDNQIFPNVNENNGMSLSEMFDACLNSIRQNNNAGDKTNKTPLNEKIKTIESLSNENLAGFQPHKYPADFGTIFQNNQDVKFHIIDIEKRNNEEAPNIKHESPAFCSSNNEKEIKNRLLQEKMRRNFLKLYLKKWRIALVTFEHPQSESGFHQTKKNNFTIKENKDEEFILKTRPFFSSEKSDKKDDDQENLLSECMSFYDIEEQINTSQTLITRKSPKRDHFDKITLIAKENQDNMNKIILNGKEEIFQVSSPKISRKNSKKQILEDKNQLDSSQCKEKRKDKERIKGSENINESKKSPRRELPKKEFEKVEKPKVPTGNSSIKKNLKGSSGISTSLKKSSNIKVGKEALNKENSQAYKTSPAKPKKISIMIGK